MASTVQARSALGNTIKYHPDDGEATEAARRALTEAKLERHIREAVAAAPPLTEAVRAKLALLLHPGTGGRNA
jgi:hypothetical protein